MKLDLCIYETLSYTSVPWKLHLWVWLSITTNTNYTNIWEYFVRGRAEDNIWSLPNLLYKFNWRYCTWKYLEKPAVSYSSLAWYHKYWIAVRHYACYRNTTNNKLTFLRKVLVFFDGKQSFEPCPIVLFGVLFRLDTSSSHTHGRHHRAYKGHFQLKHSTTERHIRPCFRVLCPAYKPRNSFTGIWQYSRRAWCRNHDT